MLLYWLQLEERSDSSTETQPAQHFRSAEDMAEEAAQLARCFDK